MNLLIVMLMVSTFAFADYSPSNVQAALKKIYPDATDIAWSHKGEYYVADFMHNGFETDVWFNPDAHWVMTETEWETLDNVSSAIYNAFSQGQYSNGQVEEVTLVEFPNRPAVVVIEVEQYNEDIEVQLFYAQDGTLLNSRNLGYTEGNLWPETFDF